MRSLYAGIYGLSNAFHPPAWTVRALPGARQDNAGGLQVAGYRKTARQPALLSAYWQLTTALHARAGPVRFHLANWCAITIIQRS